MRRSLAALLALLNIANGLWMLFAGPTWYATVPGATHTGPFNPHFVQDIGAAFLVAGLGLAARAWRPALWPAGVTGAAFLAAHGLIHLADIFAGHAESPARDIAVVVIPAMAALYASLPSNKEFAMRKWFARRYLQRYRNRYNYDTSYMEMVLDEAPDAFFKFARIFGIANYRKAVPVDAIYAAKITGALHEDCGPCTQLVVDMALEAGVANDQIEAVLKGKCAGMNDATTLGFRFAKAVCERSTAEDEAREAVRAEWGNQGVIELSFALQVGRIFPMLKAGLGYAKECRRVVVEGRNVDVIKQAA
jgi:hypothetical protein